MYAFAFLNGITGALQVLGVCVILCMCAKICMNVCVRARPLCIHKFIRYSLTHTRVAEPRQVSSMRIKSGYAHVVYTYLYIFDAYRVKLCTCYIHMHIHI